MSVTFATCCWERDWPCLLLDPNYLAVRQIGCHLYPFAEKILIINNVANLAPISHTHARKGGQSVPPDFANREAANMGLHIGNERFTKDGITNCSDLLQECEKWGLDSVYKKAMQKVKEGILSHVYIANDSVAEVLSFFQLKRSDFVDETDIPSDWVYYNALGPLTALYFARSDYFLYLTGDVTLPKPCSWIDKAIQKMEQNREYRVANLIWNDNMKEVKRESYKKEGDFFVAHQGFSDQMFLVRTEEFRQPIYSEIRADSHHYPRGAVWEKRVFSYLKNRNLQRITYRKGHYIHENF
jgi:hypothetical protein